MTSSWLYILVPVLLVAGYPLLLAIHELGHALVVLAYGRPVTVVTGEEHPSLRIRLGRLTLRLSPLARRGHCEFESRGLPIHRRRMVLRGGPVASALAAVVLAACTYLFTQPNGPAFWILLGWAGIAALDACNSGWPRKHVEREHWDGAKLRRMRSFESHYVPVGGDTGRARVA